MTASSKGSGTRPSPRVVPGGTTAVPSTFQFFPTPSTAASTAATALSGRPPQSASKPAVPLVAAAPIDSLSLSPPPQLHSSDGPRHAMPSRLSGTKRTQPHPSSASSSSPAHREAVGEPLPPNILRTRGQVAEKRSRSPTGSTISPTEQRVPLVALRAAASEEFISSSTASAPLPSAVSEANLLSGATTGPVCPPPATTTANRSTATPLGEAGATGGSTLRGNPSGGRPAATSLPSSAVGTSRTNAGTAKPQRSIASLGDAASRHRTPNTSAAVPAVRCHSSGSLAAGTTGVTQGFSMSRASVSCASQRGMDHEANSRRAEVERIRRELYKWNEQLRQEAEARQQAHQGSLDGV